MLITHTYVECIRTVTASWAANRAMHQFTCTNCAYKLTGTQADNTHIQMRLRFHSCNNIDRQPCCLSASASAAVSFTLTHRCAFLHFFVQILAISRKNAAIKGSVVQRICRAHKSLHVLLLNAECTDEIFHYEGSAAK